jgi:hypothetical protein
LLSQQKVGDYIFWRKICLRIKGLGDMAKWLPAVNKSRGNRLTSRYGLKKT